MALCSSALDFMMFLAKQTSDWYGELLAQREGR
jgi:hypothetical protein